MTFYDLWEFVLAPTCLGRTRPHSFQLAVTIVGHLNTDCEITGCPLGGINSFTGQIFEVSGNTTNYNKIPLPVVRFLSVKPSRKFHVNGCAVLTVQDCLVRLKNIPPCCISKTVFESCSRLVIGQRSTFVKSIELILQ